ncbi:anti-sigma F factor antagonist [soil metagenome]
MNQPGLAVEVVRLGSRAEVRLAGEIDVATAPTLRDAIHQVVDAGVERIVVDLAAVTFLDSFAINAIEEVRLRADVQPDRIVVVNPSPLAARIFEIVGLAELVRREPPEAGASDCVGRAQQ